MSEELMAAALAYGDAQVRYKAAFDAWRKTHPDLAAVEGKMNVLDNPSWQAEVQATCKAVNHAARRLCDEAERLYALSCTITGTLKETP